MNADTVGELHLRQFALAAKLPDFPADELELGWLIHAGFVDFYGVGTINFPSIYGLGGHLSRAEKVQKTHRNVHLLRELIKRDFHARFTGSALGVFWAVLQPLSLVFLYWFVFTYMFRRPVGQDDHYIDFLIAGLLPWLAINEGLMRSSTSIVARVLRL